MRSLLLAPLAACSFLAVDAPSRPAAPTDDCHVESSAPAIDGVMFVAGLFGTLIAMVPLSIEAFGCCDRLTHREALALSTSGAIAGIYGISGVWGAHQIARCRRLDVLTPSSPPRPRP